MADQNLESSQSVLHTVLSGGYLRRSLVVTLVVGTVLNMINQPEALLGQAPLIWWKLLLTYCVPFAVASYGAYSALASGAPGSGRSDAG